MRAIWTGHFANKRAVVIEYLDAAITTIGDIDVSLRVRRNAMGRVELSRSLSCLAPLSHPIAVVIELGDPRINVATADEDVAFPVPGNVSR